MSEEIIQGTPEWFAIRLGKCTGSRIHDVTARTKSGPSTSRANYAAQLVAERLTGLLAPSYKSEAMKNGTERQPAASAAYCFFQNCDVQEVGFVHHPTIPMAGCSPDGLVGHDGMVEFKCPLTATHIETLLGGSIDGKYIKQAQWQLACRPERKWNDWVSFCPELPQSMQLFVQRIDRDERMIAELEQAVREFLAEVEHTVNSLNERYAVREAA